eukprot:scaffold20867_cov66-Phaeocystis_antarctica.AAC.1
MLRTQLDAVAQRRPGKAHIDLHALRAVELGAQRGGHRRACRVLLRDAEQARQAVGRGGGERVCERRRAQDQHRPVRVPRAKCGVDGELSLRVVIAQAARDGGALHGHEALAALPRPVNMVLRALHPGRREKLLDGEVDDPVGVRVQRIDDALRIRLGVEPREERGPERARVSDQDGHGRGAATRGQRVEWQRLLGDVVIVPGRVEALRYIHSGLHETGLKGGQRGERVCHCSPPRGREARNTQERPGGWQETCACENRGRADVWVLPAQLARARRSCYPP